MTIEIYNFRSGDEYRTGTKNDAVNFNKLVLEHIKINQPDGSLQELMTEIKALLPGNPVTMTQLNSALLYSDTILRNDPEYMGYTAEILDKRTCQLLGLNVLTNAMLNNMVRHNDEDKDLI